MKYFYRFGANRVRCDAVSVTTTMLNEILLIITGLLLFLYLCFNVYLYRKRRQYTHFVSPPIRAGPLWFFGHALQLGERVNPDTCFTDVMLEMSRELDSENFVLHVLSVNFVVILDKTTPAKILTNHRVFLKQGGKKDNIAYINGNRVFGERGLVTEVGSEIWYHKRRVMDAAFHKNSLKGLLGKMNDISKKLSLYLSESARRENLDVYELFTRVALETICRCGFNLNDDLIYSHDVLLPKAFNDIFYATQLQFQCCFKFAMPWNFRKEKQQLKKSIDMVRSSLAKRLSDKIESQKLHSDSEKDILHYIIKGNFFRDKLDTEDVIDDFFAFVLAGTETTAIVMALVLFFMIKNPKIAAKVKAEVSLLRYQNINMR